MNYFDKPFRNINFLSKTMDAYWLRHEAISNNIANVNTPKYKKNEVQFESIIKDMLNANSIKGRLTHSRHIPIGYQNANDVEPIVTKEDSTRYRKDGNNVDIDVEMGNLAKNTIQYNVLAQRMSDHFRKFKMVIKDGR